VVENQEVAAISAAIAQSRKPRLLFITHAWGGGVERHVSDLVAITSSRVDILVLRGFLNEGVELQWHSGESTSTVARVGGFSSVNAHVWIDALRALSFERIHLHHIHGWPDAILDVIHGLELPIDITVHDYAAVCPQYHLADENGRYCGEPDEAGCAACIAKRPNPWGLNIKAWRETMQQLFSKAERVIVPSADVSRRIERYLPSLKPLLWPHYEPDYVPIRSTKVAIIGALSKVKGLDVAIATIAQAKKTAPELAFKLIGHSAQPLPAGFTFTGSYDEPELSRLIAEEKPDVLWFPSQVPETFSYTLSVAIASGLPIVASALGAQIGRLEHRTRCELVQYDASPQIWISALVRAAGLQQTTQPDAVERNKESIDYADRYLSVLNRVSTVHANVSSLTLLLSSAPSAPSAPRRPIASIFDIARRGGHRESMDFIEAQIKSLSPLETALAGEAESNAVRKEVVALREELRTTIEAYRHERRETLERNEQLANAIAIHEGNIERMQADGRNAAKHIAHLEQEFNRVTNSLSWKITRPARGLLRAFRLLQRLLTLASRVLFNERDAGSRLLRLLRRGGAASLVSRLKSELHDRDGTKQAAALAKSATPTQVHPISLRTSSSLLELSIIIPVYSQHLTTFACLASIAEHSPICPFEVIVMDDAAEEIASESLACVSGVRFIRNETNLGFIGNVNRGAEMALGRYLLILNNDTIVTRGAIDTMIETFHAHQRVGMVGAKLLNTDGTLQEAGGIVWRDGSAWNWGRNEDPANPKFNFVRDADYCSGAALLIERKLFRDLGSFDAHFAPAYYEDTDLAFRIRAHGLRVLYQPHAEIYHLEGVSHGRDASSGIKAYQTANEKKFFERWKKQLLSHRENAQQPDREAHRNTKLNVLIVEACMITPDQDSGSIRMLNLLKIFKQEGHHVTFLADNLEGTPKYRSQLESIGIETLHGIWAGSTRRLLRERGNDLDVIFFCRHYIASAYIDTVRLLAPHAKIFFDTVDLHFLREEREAKLVNDQTLLAAARITRDKELSVIRKSDVTIVVSDVEQRLLSEIVPSAKLEVISNIHIPVGEMPGFESREGILFVGGFRHPPNADAITWYAKEILPHIQRLLPGVVTRVVGSNVPDAIRALENEQLQVLGFVENIEPLLRASKVSIAPLRYGAGVKGKINEAMNYGIPVVATPLAIEGMGLSEDIDVMVAKEAEEFALAIASLYREKTRWESIARNGLRNVNEKFSMDRALATLQKLLV
jgi:O-antigen biosynthesis protein